MANEYRDLCLALFDLGAVRFGDFVLSHGAHSPLYVDLRLLFSYPKLFKQVVAMWAPLVPAITPLPRVCGAPYGAVPLATLLSAQYDMPLLLLRKEAKEHGRKKSLEGEYAPGDHCLVVEDVVTSGGSLIRTVQALQEVGLICHPCTLLDRQQGGEAAVWEETQTRLRSLLNMSELLACLHQEGRLSEQELQDLVSYLQKNAVKR